MTKTFSLEKHMNNSIKRLMMNALKATFSNPKGTAFVLKMQQVFNKSEKKRKIYLEKEGVHIPPFLISSIATDCNLYCKGCYARANSICSNDKTVKPNELSADKWKKIFEEAAQAGISFNLLAGGEPLLRRDVIEAASQIKEMIFPVFTNGTMINEEYIDLFSANLNLIPILSIEGEMEQTDERRGKGVYNKIIEVMKLLNSRKLFYGTSLTVTTENMDIITSPAYIKNLQSLGCKIVFFVEYVPTDASTAHLALDENNIEILEKKLELLRSEMESIIFLSFPGDEKAMGGCLAAGRGFFHISPDGKAEACPFSPYSDRNIADLGLIEALKSPFFEKLRSSGLVGGEHTGGCTLFEHENEVKNILATSQTTN